MLREQKIALFLATGMLRRSSKGGLLLIILIIALVFTNMLFLSSMVQGAVQLFNENTVEFSTAEIVVKPLEKEGVIGDVDALLERVNSIPGVRRAAPRYVQGATLFYRGKSLSLPVTAIRPEDEREVTRVHARMKEGDFLSPGETGSIIIGALAAGSGKEGEDIFESLGGARAGDRIEVMYANGVRREYRVKGVFQTRFYQVDYTAFVTWEEMEEVLGGENPYATSVAVNLEGDRTPERMVTTLMRYGVQEDVMTWKQAMGIAVEQAVESYRILNDITVLVSLVIALVVIFIVNTIKTMNNRRQIGILRALGIGERVIVQSYLFQVMLLAFAGTLLGLILVQGLVLYFQTFPLEFPEGNVSLFVQPAEMAISAVYLFLTSCIAGMIPAWRISREPVLEAMRR